MKYKRLMAEMLVKGITKDDLGELLGKSRSGINIIARLIKGP